MYKSLVVKHNSTHCKQLMHILLIILTVALHRLLLDILFNEVILSDNLTSLMLIFIFHIRGFVSLGVLIISGFGSFRLHGGLILLAHVLLLRTIGTLRLLIRMPAFATAPR